MFSDRAKYRFSWTAPGEYGFTGKGAGASAQPGSGSGALPGPSGKIAISQDIKYIMTKRGWSK
jgi:hypothetical protein